MPWDLAIGSGRGCERGAHGFLLQKQRAVGKVTAPQEEVLSRRLQNEHSTARAPGVAPSPTFCPAQSGGQAPLHRLEPHRWRCTFCIDADTERTHTNTQEPCGALTTGSPGLSWGCR